MATQVRRLSTPWKSVNHQPLYNQHSPQRNKKIVFARTPTRNSSTRFPSSIHQDSVAHSIHDPAHPQDAASPAYGSSATVHSSFTRICTRNPADYCSNHAYSARFDRDVDLLAQQYRIVLVNFTCLDAEYERLQGSNELKEFTAAALPLVQTAWREALGDVWCQSQLAAAAVRVVSTMSEALTHNLGEMAEGMLQHIIGETPPALQLAHYLTPQAVIGIFRQRGSDYLLRLRSGYAGSLVLYILAQIAGPMLRNSENSTLRIFLDRNIRGVTKGKGKGRGKGKGKGKAAAPGKGGRGRGAGNRAKAESVPRIVKLLRPPPAPPPPPRPSGRSYYGPLWRRVFKRLAEYHNQLVCLDLAVSLSSFVHC